MRIFYASDTSPNASIQSNLWRNNLLLPLRDLGHEVVEFDYDFGETFRHLDPALPQNRKFIERNRPALSAELLRQIKAAHGTRPFDLFFSYFYDACVLPETIDEIRALGIKTVNWYCNGSYQLHLVSQISPHYDWCLVPEKFRLPDYKKMGANPIYCQEAANPNIYKPRDVAQEYDVVFVGQAYGERPGLIHWLLEAEIDIRVWGTNWREVCSEEAVRRRRNPVRRVQNLARALVSADGRQLLSRKLGRAAKASAPISGDGAERSAAPSLVVLPSRIMGGPLSDDEMIAVYSRAKINLGFSSCGDTHLSNERIVQVRLRDFEVPMSGGFYMVEYMEELEEFYEIGREIVCYAGPDELVDKIKYYLKHDGEREAIRRRGHERCLRDHTWHKRFQTAFAQMGLQ